MSTLIAISTYLKNAALTELLDSLIANGYHEGNRLMICDDSDDHQAKPVFDEYRKKCKLVYSAGERGGIAVNKNRAIKYFLAKTHFKDLLLLDDDLLFLRYGLIEECRTACEEIGLPFITGMWIDFYSNKEEKVKGSDGRGWFSSFPIKSSTFSTTSHQGSHGCVMHIQREAVEKVGYFNKFSYFYSHEHSAYFSRLLRTYGRCPELFPVIKNSSYYYKGNQIPNNYEIDMDQVWNVNGREHAELLQKVYAGESLYNKEHNLSKKKENTIES